MSKIHLSYSPGATPLSPDEKKDLIPKKIKNRKELNEAEKENIVRGIEWLDRQKNPNALAIEFHYKLHKKMFGNVWKWAGKLRKTDKSIGDVPPQKILERIGGLFDETKSWIENDTYPWDEIATRFHHKLVFIHPFPDGNGRYARSMTDVLLTSNNKKPFTWGQKAVSSSINTDKEIRKSYVSALQKADRKNYADLLKFVRS